MATPRKRQPKQDTKDVVRLLSQSGLSKGERWGVVKNAKTGGNTQKAGRIIKQELGGKAAKQYRQAVKSIKKRTK